MPSPFPGMDPYLEGPEIWEDFHANLAAEIQRQLNPRLRPRYFAALTPRVTYDEIVVQETHSVKPDVSVLRASDRPMGSAATAIAPAPAAGLIVQEVPVTEQSIEIRDAASGVLVTAIEILSPVNKRSSHEAHEAYVRERRDLLRSAAHLMEIDLLRGGRRPPLVTRWPESPYVIALSREERRPKIEIWPLRLQESIPILPVPLRLPDPDVPIDLGSAIRTIHDLAAYDLRIDYTRPPPKPDLPPDDAAWLESHLRSIGVRS